MLGYYDYDIHDVVDAVCAAGVLLTIIIVSFVFIFGV